MNNLKYWLLCLAFLCAVGDHLQAAVKMENLSEGIYKLSLGKDAFNPFDLLADSSALSRNVGIPMKPLPFDLSEVKMRKTERGVQIAIPLGDNEQLYGFGLQIGSFQQRGLKKRPIVNDYPLNNLGYTHAPQPFYVSTAGYGIVVNTSRYTTFLCGTNELKKKTHKSGETEIRLNTDDLYADRAAEGYVFVDVEDASGVEVFVLQGCSITDVMRRYNLLSGGGCLPPMWGLGLKYRVKSDFTADQVLDIARYFRESLIPCDVIGLEPGWQTHAYSCSYVWDGGRFPRPKAMIDSLHRAGFRVNLWEHAYVNPASPLYEPLYAHSGNFLVWNGLVPDFLDPEAVRLFSGHHQTLLDDGVDGFKLDECDNSNIGKGDSNWGFPDLTEFGSDIDGEQMHQLYGSLYLRTLSDLYKANNVRSYFDYRSSGLFMSSFPATLYSDTYDRKQYAEMVANSGFTGLLWSPELRESHSEMELVRRLQLVLMSSQAVVNGWYLNMPPWLQYEVKQNVAGVKVASSDYLENTVRQLAEMRMSLIPYLYAAFYDYYLKGIPPFRALIADYSNDEKARSVSDQFLLGENLMAAPVCDDSSVRSVYFPEGEWYDLYTHEKYEGGKSYTLELPLERLPLFVKSGTILPLARPVQQVSDTTQFEVDCLVFGKTPHGFTLYEDDGASFNYQKGQWGTLELTVDRKGKGRVKETGCQWGRYKIKDWKFIK